MYIPVGESADESAATRAPASRRVSFDLSRDLLTAMVVEPMPAAFMTFPYWPTGALRAAIQDRLEMALEDKAHDAVARSTAIGERDDGHGEALAMLNAVALHGDRWGGHSPPLQFVLP